MNATPPPTPSRAAAVYRWFGHPLVGVVGWVCTVVSVPLAIWLYTASIHKPGLTYFVNPGKAAVIRASQASDFTVTYGGKVLTGDVTATQVAFWNAGDAPIHSTTVLKPLRIRTQPSAPVFEVQLRKSSRDVVQLNIDRSRLEQGEVTVRWNILEKNDGAIIQLIYLGGEAVSIRADAVIEGQPEIIEQSYTESKNPDSYAEKLKESTLHRVFGPALLILLSLTLILPPLLSLFKPDKTAGGWMGLILGLFVLGTAIYELFHPPPAPPFGF